MFAIKTILSLVFMVCAAATSHGDDAFCTISDFSRVQEVIENCTDIKVSNLKVPAGTTLNLSLRPGSNLVFEGRTYFEYSEWKGPLIALQGENLVVTGAPGSVIDGQGELYWDRLGGNGGIIKPKLFKLNVTHSVVEYINLKNCPVHCVLLQAYDTVINGWDIDVSEGDKDNFTGHNTDGFDVNGNDLVLANNVVRNQDDCVVINKGSNIRVSNISCYGGHGLSISVGFSQTDFAENSVRDVIFENSIVSRSPNGIHIKTHSDSGAGIVENIEYRNIVLEDINNFGLNIQQDYSNGEATGNPATNIPIVGLILKNISGYMKSFNESPTLAAQILCGEGACSNWIFRDINIKGAKVASNCTFVPPGYTC